jgi:signal transduction histidine kinase
MGPRPARSDIALSLALVVGGLFEVWAIDGLGLSSSAKAGMSAGVLVVGACVALRRTVPVASALSVLGALTVVALAWTDSAAWEIAAVGIVEYGAARHTGRRGAVIVLIGGLLFGLLVGFLEGVEGLWNFLGNYAFVATLMIGVPWAGGRAIRTRHELSIADAEHAAAAERLRIARELHDIVGQALGVIVVQAEGERATLPPEAASTRETLATIARTAREALDDVRRLLLVMREDERRLGPPPGLVDLPRLMESLDAVGLPCELVVEGDERPLSSAIDLSAYRVVQEALTNTVRHARAGQARVTIRYGTDAIDIEVVDDGRTVPESPSRGFGLLGMRERVAVYGGTVEAGPRAGGGFAVAVHLPTGGRGVDAHSRAGG